MLADAFIVGRHIEQNLCAIQSQETAWRNGCPHILAYFYSKRIVFRLEYLSGSDWESSRISIEADELIQGTSVGEPAHLIEFFIVGKISFGYNAFDCSVVDYCSSII